MTRDTACSLSNSFPGFRCIGMLPRIYWRETVWFRATHRSLAIGQATLLAWHVWALKYVSESIPKFTFLDSMPRLSLEVLNIITLVVTGNTARPVYVYMPRLLLCRYRLRPFRSDRNYLNKAIYVTDKTTHTQYIGAQCIACYRGEWKDYEHKKVK